MSALVERNLGPEALDWIRQCLAGGETLARLILDRLDLTPSRITTFLPEEVSEEKAKQFQWDGVLPPLPADSHLLFPHSDGSITRLVPVPNMESCLVEIIRAFLRAQPDHVCIFAEQLARPEDPGLLSPGTRVLIFDGNVYHLLLSDDSENRIIDTTVAIVNLAYPPMIGVMTHRDKNYQAPMLNREIVEGFVEMADKIVVGAYDGEGFLLWHRLPATCAGQADLLTP